MRDGINYQNLLGLGRLAVPSGRDADLCETEDVESQPALPWTLVFKNGGGVRVEGGT